MTALSSPQPGAEDSPVVAVVGQTLQPDDTLARVMYGPAMQTTVVTTTTTTTTEFPPLVLKAPRKLHDLDARQYPLATSRTPEAMRRIKFEVDGHSAVLEEADDALQSAQMLAQRQAQNDGQRKSSPSPECYFQALGPEDHPRKRRLISRTENRPPLFEDDPLILSPTSTSDGSDASSLHLPSPKRGNVDLTLPSPSLSPVTAAARHLSPTRCRSTSSNAMAVIPDFVQVFDGAAEDLQKYLIMHLLRRCSKPVLQMVAETVNPALKWDFIRHLPPELSELVLGYLDVKSLCAAAQVSRRWRQKVDTAEKVWKRLFYQHRFELQHGELPRAIREGWGWQARCNIRDAEQDLSATASPVPAHGKRTRQIQGKITPKLARRRRVRDSYRRLDDDALVLMTSTNDGPYAAASAAAAAVFLPNRHLHLWKSMFVRHHMIRQTWLQQSVKPHHISFGAHQRHVVTCLQFDADKILTGSDDANINVFDTQTGALRAKLEGHEGGVWALQYEGNVLVSGSTDRSVRVWDIERGICTHVFHGHTSTVRCLQLLFPTPTGEMQDGKAVLMPKQPLIITGSRDAQLRVWRLPKQGDGHFHQPMPLTQGDSSDCPYFVSLLAGHHHSVRAIAAHADTLVSGSYDCTVRVWKISTGETVHRLQGHSQKVYSVVLDSKRRRCISGSMDNVVKVWSLESGAALFNLEGHSSLVGLLDLQDDLLVSAAADSTLRIWNPENGHCTGVLTAHTGAITCFQHDSQKVVSGSDRTLKMWSMNTGEFGRDLLTDLSGVWQVKFNERRCVAAVQRNNSTFIEVLDFGACRDGIPEEMRGRRIIVDMDGREIKESAIISRGPSQE